MVPKDKCPNCQRLQAEVESLKAKIASLEAQLRWGHRQAVPFSRDEAKPEPKAPGRRPGQGQFRYRQKPPEESFHERVEVHLSACPECGGPLEEKATHERVQIDLPEVEPIICSTGQHPGDPEAAGSGSIGVPH